MVARRVEGTVKTLLVVWLAPVVAALWLTLQRCRAEPLLATKMAGGHLFLAVGFLVAAWAAQRALAHGPVGPARLISAYLLHTLGELFLSPVGLSAVTTARLCATYRADDGHLVSRHLARQSAGRSAGR